jgi:hypothetical protein
MRRFSVAKPPIGPYPKWAVFRPVTPCSIMLDPARRLKAGSVPSCLPRPAREPPAGPGWIHEIKHDGFRILARKDARSVRLFTRNGYDFPARFPMIAAAVEGLPVVGDGAIIYKHACQLGCEGIVSKRLSSPYRSGCSDQWLKITNPTAPAVKREAEEDWGDKRQRSDQRRRRRARRQEHPSRTAYNPTTWRTTVSRRPGRRIASSAPASLAD